MADKKISQLDSTTSVNTGAMFPLSQTESGSLKTVKGTVDQIGDYIAKTQDHSTLNTVSKKIIGAINEILESGIGDIEETASGSVALFADGGDNIPVKSLAAEIVASQSGSGTPSPSNPRAISGYTDVVIKNDVQGTTQATYTINLGSTVYGGMLDVTKGILTVTHTLLDMGSVDWVKSAVDDYSVYYYIPSDKDDTFDFICSCFNAVEKTRTNLSDLEIGTYNSTNAMNRLTVRYDAISTVADFKTAVTGQYVVYKLATPIVIQLTPTEVVTLLGENNIYANSGDVEVEYFTEDASQFNDLIETIITSSSSDYHVYSTNEKVVGRWIDGKPIYEKTINCGLFPNNSRKNFASLTDVDLLIYMNGFAYSTGNSRPLPFSADGANAIRLDYVNGNLGIVTYSDWSSYSGYVIVRYTKTTD